MTDTITAPESTEQAFDYDRTVALSDGVFAIALTLLVLTISFPELTGAARHHLSTDLAHRLPQLYSYALSFAVLAFLWLRHHAFFRSLKRIDTRIAVVNLAYLALVAFLPYPTRLLGVYGDQAVSVVIYAVTITLIGLVTTAIRLHAVRAGLTEPAPGHTWIWPLAAPAVFLISIPLALLVSPVAGQWFWLALVLAPLAARRAARAQSMASTEIP